LFTLLNSFWWIGWGTSWGSFIYPVTQEQVNGEKDSDEVTQNVRECPTDDGQDGSDEVEGEPDGSVAELQLPEEGELGVEDGNAAEHVRQEQ